METGLFEIQADHLSTLKRTRQVHPAAGSVVYAMFERPDLVGVDPDPAALGNASTAVTAVDQGPQSVNPAFNPAIALGQCFLRLSNLPNYALDRLSRYEAILWRQAGQILVTLDTLHRRKPQERSRRFFVGGR